VVINTDYRRINVTGAATGQATSWLKADLSMQYSKADNNQPYKGEIGPLIGLLLWPQTDNAKDYLTPSGQRRRLTNLGASAEVDNPYFNLSANRNNNVTSQIIANLGLTLTPVRWASLQTNIGTQTYISEALLLRNPQSASGFQYNGVLDLADDVTRNTNMQTVLNFNTYQLTSKIAVRGLVANAINDSWSQTNAIKGQDFLDPAFVSANNTVLRTNRTTLLQRRLVGVFGSATVSYDNYLFVTATGRNDWTSTIPVERNSFFYPGVNAAFVFSDAFPSVAKFVSGKLRAGYAAVGRDARPYAFRPSLESKLTANGGYGYGFTGPNLGLKPEFKTSVEFGAELSFLKNRVGLDITHYKARTTDQIVNDIRGSYATGFILFNLNGAETENQGVEATLRLSPIQTASAGWDITTNFERARGKTLKIPNDLPESYVSDTWLFGNVRNGTAPNLSTRSLTGFFYQRNNQKQLLIDPTTGLPLRSATFIDGGYDRQPDYSIGITNTFRFKNFQLSMLLDVRRGGDVFNATEHYLTTRGLSMRTLDRWEPRVVEGVLRDGKENSSTPTKNTIVVVPGAQTEYYRLMSEELFIEKDINWFRLRDVTLRYQVPNRYFKARDVSVWVRGTDLFLFTNYSGLDPVVNGNTAAVGGSGASGIDFGNFPMPRGFAFGVKLGY